MAHVLVLSDDARAREQTVLALEPTSHEVFATGGAELRRGAASGLPRPRPALRPAPPTRDLDLPHSARGAPARAPRVPRAVRGPGDPREGRLRDRLPRARHRPRRAADGAQGAPALGDAERGGGRALLPRERGDRTARSPEHREVLRARLRARALLL